MYEAAVRRRSCARNSNESPFDSNDAAFFARADTPETVECPVLTTTTTFGLLTPEGRYITFDEPSNTKIVEVVKTNTGWTRFITERKPLRVKVIGTANGDVVVMESIR